jgi:hypothetical protein
MKRLLPIFFFMMGMAGALLAAPGGSRAPTQAEWTDQGSKIQSHYSNPDFSETFNRSNEPLEDSANWSALAGSLAIVSNTCIVDTTDTSYFQCDTHNSTNGAIEVGINFHGTSGDLGVIFRAQDTSNFYLVTASPTDNAVSLYKMVSDTPTLLDSGGTVDNDTAYTLDIQFDSANKIIVAQDFVPVIDYTDSSSPYTSGGTLLYAHTAAANLAEISAFKTWDATYWDWFLSGSMSPGAIVKIGATYYLYYLGSDGVGSSGEQRHRYMGVATSSDCITWTPYAGNPIYSYKPNSGETEGTFSVSGYSDGSTAYLYTGDMLFTESPPAVHSNVRALSTTNGTTLADNGIVLGWNNTSIYGYGDELAPAGVYANGTGFNLFYIPNGVDQTKYLCVATLSNQTHVVNTTRVGTDTDIWDNTGSTAMPNGNILLSRGHLNATTQNFTADIEIVSPTKPTGLYHCLSYDFADGNSHSVIYHKGNGQYIRAYAVGTLSADIGIMTANVTKTENLF